MRLYNPALGKFLSVDPIANQYPELTPYQFASNTPIQAIDLDGLEAASVSKLDFGGKTVILSVNTGGMINKSATNFDAAGLSPVGMQRNSAIVTQKAAVAQARAKAGRSEFKADLRSDYQRSQSIQTLQQMEIQKGMSGRRDLDPVGYYIGSQPVIQHAAVGLLTQGAGNLFLGQQTAVQSYLLNSTLGAAGDYGQASVLAGGDHNKIDMWDIGTNLLPGKGIGRDIVKNILDAGINLTGENGYESISNGKILPQKAVFDAGSGIAKDCLKELGGGLYNGQNASLIQKTSGAVLTRSFDAAWDGVSSKVSDKVFSEPKKQ